jgi:hypothetical protein
MSDPFEWSAEVVIMAFAARPIKPMVSYEDWCLRLGLTEKMKKEQEEDENSVALSQLRAVNPDVKIEEHKIPNIVITPAERPE